MLFPPLFYAMYNIIFLLAHLMQDILSSSYVQASLFLSVHPYFSYMALSNPLMLVAIPFSLSSKIKLVVKRIGIPSPFMRNILYLDY
jgi:hypothetical protein